MTSVEPDFLSRIDESANRFAQNIDPSPKAQSRLQANKKAYLNQNILLRIVPSSKYSITIKSESRVDFQIPRIRLTQPFLQDAVNRSCSSTAMLLLSHLHHTESNTVILPQDMQTQCQSSPIVYDIIVRSAGVVKQGGLLSRSGKRVGIPPQYNGDILFIVHDVPQTSHNGRHVVTQDDVHRWIISGAISDEKTIKLPSSKVDNLRGTLLQLEKELKKLPTTPLYNENGRALNATPLKDAREEKFKFLQEEKEQTRNQLEKAEKSLEEARSRHVSNCPLIITPRPRLNQHNDSDTSNSTSWNIKVLGKHKDHYTNLIATKKNWSINPMYAVGVLDRKVKSQTDSAKGDTQVQHVKVSNKAEHLVDVGRISIEQVPDGFGILEDYDEYNPFSAHTQEESDKDYSIGHHRLYHGHFYEGDMSGKGTLYTNAVYSGDFLKNEPCGRGTMDYPDGLSISGDFRLEEGVESPLGPNPYRRGLPHGKANIQFLDGATYDGEMQNGKITGKGMYRHNAEEKR